MEQSRVCADLSGGSREAYNVANVRALRRQPMSNSSPAFRLSFSASAAQIDAVEAFRVREGLPSRAEALRLLLDIALDSVTKSGRRFWDRSDAS